MSRVGVHHAVMGQNGLARSLDKILEDAQLTGELKLSGRKLKDFPKGASKFKLADTILADLSKNRLSELPGEVCDYAYLERLTLHHNVIKTLPESVINLQQLTHLDLSRNSLSVVPGCVCGLASLRVLDLSGNRLVSLPEDIGSLQNLIELDASYNQLAHLPPTLGDLDNLRSLNLRRNLLQNVPTELCFLHLVMLDLSGNRIASLPTELRFMSSLVSIILENNPLQQPPANLCSRGCVHIFKWLEMAAAKEDKKRGVLSEVEFRKRRKMSSVTELRYMNGLLDSRHKRSTMDSGYSTSDNGERWSQESQDSLEYEDTQKLALRAAEYTREQRQRCNVLGGINGTSISTPAVNGLGLNSIGGTNGKLVNAGGLNGVGVSGGSTTNGHDSHDSSGLSTPSTLSPGDGFNLEDEFNKALKMKTVYENGYQEKSPHIVPPTFQKPRNGFNHTNGYSIGSLCVSTVSLSGAHHVPPTRAGDLSLALNPDPGASFPPFQTHPDKCSPTSPITTPRPHVPTYREYLEAKKQQRVLDNMNIYRRSSRENGLGSENHRESIPCPRPSPTGSQKFTNEIDNLPSRIHSSRPNDFREELTRADIKNIQKEAVFSYVKSRVSPSKSSLPSSPDASFDSADGSIHTISSGIYSPLLPAYANPLPQASSTPYTASNLNQSQVLISSHSVTPALNSQIPLPSQHHTTVTSVTSHHPAMNSSTRSDSHPPLGSPSRHTPTSIPKNLSHTTPRGTRRRSGGGRNFEPDSSAHLNFTYRREIEKAQHEKHLVENLRHIIESRLKVSLPADLSAALTDGVVLCHLANHVRPRSVPSIHVPSPAVPKLTVAKCRLNVDSFLEACRRIGIEEEYLCSAHDILEERGTVRIAITVERLLKFYHGRQTPISPRSHTSV